MRWEAAFRNGGRSRDDRGRWRCGGQGRAQGRRFRAASGRSPALGLGGNENRRRARPGPDEPKCFDRAANSCPPAFGWDRWRNGRELNLVRRATSRGSAQGDDGALGTSPEVCLSNRVGQGELEESPAGWYSGWPCGFQPDGAGRPARQRARSPPEVDGPDRSRGLRR